MKTRMLRAHSSTMAMRRLHDIDPSTTTPDMMNDDTSRTTQHNATEGGHQEEDEPETQFTPSTTMSTSDKNAHVDMLLNEVVFCVVVGVLFYLSYRVRMFFCSHRHSPHDSNTTNHDQQHHSLEGQSAQSSPPPSNRVTAKEKAARKVFVEANLLANEWTPFSHHENDSLEAAVVDHDNATSGDHDTTTTEHAGAVQDAKKHETTNTTTSTPNDEKDDEEEDDDDECPICLTQFQKGDMISYSTDPIGSCQHIFHRECVYAWLLDHRECPMCRHTFLWSSGDEDEFLKS